MSFATCDEFEAESVFEGEAFELAHLVGEGGLEEGVLDFECESFTAGGEVGGVGGEFGVGVAVEDEDGEFVGWRGRGEEEEGCDEFVVTAFDAEELGGDFAEGVVLDEDDAQFAGGIGDLVFGESEGEFDGFGLAGEPEWVVELEGTEPFPGFGPFDPRGWKGACFADGRGGEMGFVSGLVDLCLDGGVAQGMGEGTGDIMIAAFPCILEEAQFFFERVDAIGVGVLGHGGGGGMISGAFS